MADVELVLRDYGRGVDDRCPQITVADVERRLALLADDNTVGDWGPDGGADVRERVPGPSWNGRLAVKRRWAFVLVGAAAAVLLVVLVILALSDDSTEEQIFTEDIEEPESPAPVDDEEGLTDNDQSGVAASGLVGPGSWTVAATFGESTVSEEQMSLIVAEVGGWPGVIEVAEIPDMVAWSELTGLDPSDCDAGGGAVPCGSGVAVLTVSSSMDQTALRLENEFGISALTPADVPRSFLEGYLDAAIDVASPVPLDFDPSSLGVEQVLTGPFLDYEPANSGCSGPCSVGIEVNVDGIVVGTGIALRGSDSAVEVEFAGGGYETLEKLLIDRAGRGGVLAELRSVVERRRIYRFAGLPLEAAVITFEQADGSTVWQRPLAGMALIVDAPESGGSPEFSDQESDITQYFGPEGERSRPFSVLDAAGAEIIRIQGTPDGPLVENFRVQAATVPDQPPSTGTGVEVTNVVTVNGPVTRSIWGRAIVETGDAVWIDTADAITRIDAATGEIVGTVPVGATVDLVSSPDAVWAMDITGTISRINADTGRVTDTFETLGGDRGLGGRLWVAGGGLWISSSRGFDRIDLITLAVDTYPYPGEPPARGDRSFLGEASGALWVLEDRSRGRLWRIDLTSRRIELHDVAFDASPETYPVLAEDAVWFIDCCDGDVAPYDLAIAALGEALNLGGGLAGVYADGAVWVHNRNRGTITRIDTSTRAVTDVITVDPALTGLVAAKDGESVWALFERGAVSRIDTAERRVTDVIDVGGDLVGLVAFDGAAWAVGETTVTRIATNE